MLLDVFAFGIVNAHYVGSAAGPDACDYPNIG
jgi:hypothetical protein